MIHKDYVLPEVDLSHDEGDPRWHEAQRSGEKLGAMGATPLYREDGTIRAYRWNGLPPGHYREYWQLCVVETWAKLVTDFEGNPDDVHAAYWYIDSHPVFWAFEQVRNDDYPANHVSRLEHEGALVHRSWPEIAPHRDDEGLIWCYEFGKRDLFKNEHGFHASWLDHLLMGHAGTYELAVIEIAGKIHENYGNDRQVVDSEEWRKGGGDG
jgi:hypothetical protein